jgi:hypothetical protein
MEGVEIPTDHGYHRILSHVLGQDLRYCRCCQQRIQSLAGGISCLSPIIHTKSIMGLPVYT